MDLHFIHKTNTSSTGNCPAAYQAANGNHVIQGWVLDGKTLANLGDLADNETAVEVPADVIERLAGLQDHPASYRIVNGNYVIRGWIVDAETRANLRDLADNETAVEVPAHAFEALTLTGTR